MSVDAHPPAASGGGGGKNKGTMVAGTVIGVLLAIGIGLFVVGPGLSAFGDGIRSFMVSVGIGIAANPTLAIIIFLIPVGLVMGLTFMAVKGVLSS